MVPEPSGVLGQTSFTSKAVLSNSAAKIHSPYGVVAGDDGILWVADTVNSRVLGFCNAATKGSGAVADLVLGKASFTDLRDGPTATLMTNPIFLSVDADGLLYVPDAIDNRVLRFSPGTPPPPSVTTPLSVNTGPLIAKIKKLAKKAKAAKKKGKLALAKKLKKKVKKLKKKLAALL